jgi:N-acetylglucosaminyldiphosphoundecaprenol N-acetyl-beta-D-mannosaminyltransferase
VVEYPSVDAQRNQDGSDSLPLLQCAGVPITACAPAEAAARLIALAMSEHSNGMDVHLCNAYTLALADGKAELRRLLQQAAINFPDGQPVVWANRLRYRHVDQTKRRVYGPDLLHDVVALGCAVGLRHYFLGSTEPVVAAMERNLRVRYPTIQIAGSDSPPFTELDEAARRVQARRIVDSSAQVVWVGLGTPKQDWEVARLASELPAVAVAVGAAFDFIAGTKRQAPAWMGAVGAEWLFRLGSEPQRLWRRYVFGNPRFIVAAARDALGSDLLK